MSLDITPPAPPIDLMASVALPPVMLPITAPTTPINAPTTAPSGPAEDLKAKDPNYSEYGSPYFYADDGEYIYYSWQHCVSAKWIATRRHMTTQFSEDVTGLNPQPQTLAELQGVFA